MSEPRYRLTAPQSDPSVNPLEWRRWGQDVTNFLRDLQEWFADDLQNATLSALLDSTRSNSERVEEVAQLLSDVEARQAASQPGSDRFDELEQQIVELQGSVSSVERMAQPENIIAAMSDKDVTVRALAVSHYLYTAPGSTANLYGSDAFTPPTSYDPGTTDPGEPPDEYSFNRFDIVP